MTVNVLHLATRLDALRTELAELAFALERRGQLEAADVAISVSARVAELREEFAARPQAAVACDLPRCGPSFVVAKNIG